MIALAALLAHSSAAETIHQKVEIDVDVDDAVDVRKLVEFLRLKEVAGKSVEKVPVLAVVPCEAVTHDLAGDFVGDEFALVDIRLGKQSDLGTVLDVGAEDISRGDVREAVALRDLGRLRALACAGRAE